MKATDYIAKQPDESGFIFYDEAENQTWHGLYQDQMAVIKNRACDQFVTGLEKLNMPQDRVPQLGEICAVLNRETGWAVQHVTALIAHDKFFNLLANRKFPAANFIRRQEHYHYIKEPDIFHEYFGHCPMLIEPTFAKFTEEYGKMALQAEPKEQIMFLRLYWFTVEFGLIQTKNGLRIYGGGILSSPEETRYALESKVAIRKPFEPLEIMRTPYRIDIKQPIYFVIDSYQQLYDLVTQDLFSVIHKARQLGEYEPAFSRD
ncbi:MAG: phenylalanine 4-monooxygenase [Pseudomonadota bacterium]